jgi:hypothetical protein
LRVVANTDEYAGSFCLNSSRLIFRASSNAHFESANIVERCRQIAVVCAMILFSEPSINGLA